MTRVKAIFLYLFLAAGVVVNGQYTKEFKRIYFDADYLMETGFYVEAFNRYKNLLTLDPGNCNILFHCGACCLKIQGIEEQAVDFLEKASKGVSHSYKEKSHTEPGAPVLTYFMLGQAYMLNYQFPEAIKAFSTYLESGTGQDPDQLEYARLQIEACKRASTIERAHPAFEFHDVLSQFKNDLGTCSNPVISGDGNVLIFSLDSPTDKKVMMSTRKDNLWSKPRLINSEIGLAGETYPTSISFDGKDLYLVHHFYSHSDIFVTHFLGSRWSKAESVGYRINRKTSEDHASISRDGRSLYFTSDARGGFGSFDIYVSHLDEKGEWGEPVNLGPTINTRFEDRTPFISKNDSVLFFSSQGHESIGGADVFYTTLRSDGTWSEPQNLGYPVNTTGDNLFFNPGWNEQESYYAVRREDDPAFNSICRVTALGAGGEMAADVPAVTLVAEPLDTEPVDTELLVAEVHSTPGIPIQGETATPGKKTPTSEPQPVQSPVPSPAPPPSEYTDQLITYIPFVTNRFDMGPHAQLEVEIIAELMSYFPESKVELTGHADATGSDEFNMLLSLQRAGSVADYLEMRGIEKERISLSGTGESSPVAKNSFSDGSDAPLGRYLNRQVYVKLTGTLPVDNHLTGLYVPENLLPADRSDPNSVEKEFRYTIQLKATLNQVPVSFFRNMGEVKEYPCSDGYFRYTTSSFRTFSQARERLLVIRRMKGYEDTFIQTREWYDKAVK